MRVFLELKMIFEAFTLLLELKCPKLESNAVTLFWNIIEFKVILQTIF